MKLTNNVLKILTLVLSVAGLALFFTNFVTFKLTNGDTVALAGAQMAFGGFADQVASNLAKSPKIIFCMILSIVAVIASAYNVWKNSVASRWFTIVTNAVSGVYMLVVALSRPWSFFDLRPFGEFPNNVSDIAYTPFVLITAIVILAAFVCGVAHQLVADSIIAKEEGKLPLLKRLVKYLREYKSEVNKIVWPNLKTVVKNTLIVLAICAIFAVFVCLLDYGLGVLIGLISHK